MAQFFDNYLTSITDGFPLRKPWGQPAKPFLSATKRKGFAGITPDNDQHMPPGIRRSMP